MRRDHFPDRGHGRGQIAAHYQHTVEYLRPGRAEDCFATGIVTKQGRRVANVRAMAWQGDRNRLFAAASAHFMMI
ncbi:MAG: hotdog domain-containing protein [Alphaproteobacteria bacterium]